MKRTDTVIIGGGQAGLAMSYGLAARGIGHVVLERGRIGEKWRSARWDSLRLLTPNWMSRLPGQSYVGPDPDGFMGMPDVIAYLERYAARSAAPVLEDTNVVAVACDGGDYRVSTNRGDWRARSVVVATGECDVPHIPAIADALCPTVRQMVPTRYRNPETLPDGGILIVGASATGVQLAEEIQASGRSVTLAAGSHIRLPRTYRGRDIMWWLDRLGTLDEPIDRVADPEKARRQPSLQLVGRDDRRSVDLGALQAGGVRITGRLTEIDGSRVRFADDLARSVNAAERKLARLVDRIEGHVAAGSGPALGPPEPLVSTFVADGMESLDLRSEKIRTIIWATGYRRHYPWLKVPVLNAAGEIRHSGGITASPGLYVLGLRFLRCRKSSFIDGVGDDALALARHLHGHLAGRTAAMAA